MIVSSDAGPGMSVFYQKPYMRYPEYGTITSIGTDYIHVLFLDDQTSKACLPHDLYWPPDFCARDGVNVPGQRFGRYEGL